jgi:general secretion pathway protein I
VSPVQRGFTLLEVLAALAIAATGLLAVARIVSTSVEVSDATDNRAVAYWVAGNHMASLRLAGTWPGIGTTTLEADNGGRRWRLERTIARTADEDVVRVRLDVYSAEDPAQPLAHLNGYLARLDPPRESAANGS